MNGAFKTREPDLTAFHSREFGAVRDPADDMWTVVSSRLVSSSRALLLLNLLVRVLYGVTPTKFPTKAGALGNLQQWVQRCPALSMASFHWLVLLAIL